MWDQNTSESRPKTISLMLLPRRFEAFAERVDGTRANITVKDAERADQKRASHRVGNVRSLSRAYATHPQFTPYAGSEASSKVSASRKKG
jgi:hypothetical protein